MNEFDSLRDHAKAKRDAAIAQARKDYLTTLAQIAAIERAIVVEQPRPTNRKPARPGMPNKLTLRQTVVALLGTRQMTVTEIVVAVIETGYKSHSPKRELHRTVAKMLRRDTRFKREGERWTTEPAIVS